MLLYMKGHWRRWSLLYRLGGCTSSKRTAVRFLYGRKATAR